jgi:signal transduction histidine kinase
MNFGSNAIKYGKPGGAATYSVSAAGPQLRITVIDTGIGIPEDKQDKIFQPFHRAGQETGPIEGTGIGLAVRKKIIERHGGKIWVESQPEVGTSFQFSLCTEGKAP